MKGIGYHGLIVDHTHLNRWALNFALDVETVVEDLY